MLLAYFRFYRAIAYSSEEGGNMLRKLTSRVSTITKLAIGFVLGAVFIWGCGDSASSTGQAIATGVMNAIEVIFDNSNGSLTSTDVQSAIEELDEKIAALEANKKCDDDMAEVFGFCIEKVERAGKKFQPAAVQCSSIGRRLCSPSEWMIACNEYGEGRIQDVVGLLADEEDNLGEWTDVAYSHDNQWNYGTTVGSSTIHCHDVRHVKLGDDGTEPSFRCCRDRG